MKNLLSAKVSFAGLLFWLGALACFFTTAGFFGRAGWLCEITSHFRVQYTACLVGLTVFFA